MSWHPEALGVRQKQVLTKLGRVMSRWQFYMGGGTATAVQLGHRRSLDLDWFTSDRIADPMLLATSIRDEGIPFVTGQIERGTLYGNVSGIRVSFLEYRYPLRQCRRMLRLLVGDECDQIRVQVTIGHPETVYCHSEPFDRLRINSAQHLRLCHPEQSEGSRDSSSLCSSE